MRNSLGRAELTNGRSLGAPGLALPPGCVDADQKQCVMRGLRRVHAETTSDRSHSTLQAAQDYCRWAAVSNPAVEQRKMHIKLVRVAKARDVANHHSIARPDAATG
jgi:hypothetical protein